jgi:hypothetical protein
MDFTTSSANWTEKQANSFKPLGATGFGIRG